MKIVTRVGPTPTVNVEAKKPARATTDGGAAAQICAAVPAADADGGGPVRMDMDGGGKVITRKEEVAAMPAWGQ